MSDVLMRLSKLRIANYRSCYDTTVSFAEHLTLIVGENDAGKSNIIDALRIAVPTATGRSSLWFEAERDLSYDALPGSVVEVERTYSDLSADEDAFYTAAIFDDERTLVHTTSFQTDAAVARRSRTALTVGKDKVADPEPENRDRIAHVYLPPFETRSQH